MTDFNRGFLDIVDIVILGTSHPTLILYVGISHLFSRRKSILERKVKIPHTKNDSVFFAKKYEIYELYVISR